MNYDNWLPDNCIAIVPLRGSNSSIRMDFAIEEFYATKTTTIVFKTYEIIPESHELSTVRGECRTIGYSIPFEQVTFASINNIINLHMRQVEKDFGFFRGELFDINYEV